MNVVSTFSSIWATSALPDKLVEVVVRKHGPDFITTQEKILNINFISKIGTLDYNINYSGYIMKTVMINNEDGKKSSFFVNGLGAYTISYQNDEIFYLSSWETLSGQISRMKVIKIVSNNFCLVINQKLMLKIGNQLVEAKLIDHDYGDFKHPILKCDIPFVDLNFPILPAFRYQIWKGNRKFRIATLGQKWPIFPGSRYPFLGSGLMSFEEKNETEIIRCIDGITVSINDKETTDYETFLNWLLYTDCSLNLSDYIKNKESRKRQLQLEPKENKAAKADHDKCH